MKKRAVFFNSPYLGGAERSMVQQLHLLNIKEKVYLYIPYFVDLSEAEHLIDLCSKSLSNVEIVFYQYPQRLFQISRSGSSLFKLLLAAFSLMKLVFILRKLKIHTNYLLWANGNKVALPILLNLFIFGRDNKLIWHFRDYPTKSIFMRFSSFLFKNSKRFETFCVGNSLDVSRAIDQILDIDVSNFAYNPVGEMARKEYYPKKKVVIGTASMFAPWKGIHQVIIMANIYQNELKDLGVEKIKIFGDMIYKTDGDHNSYLKSLEALASNNNLIEFVGNAKPKEIYQNIDVLIHSSLEPEPFGRVILEGLKTGTCILTSGLGGSGELVEHNKSALIFQAYEYADLYHQIYRYSTDLELRKRLYDFSFHRANSLETLAYKQLHNFFQLVENR